MGDPAELPFLDGRQVEDDAIRFRVHEEIYPLPAIQGACWIFLDKAFVRLARPADRVVEVRLKPRKGGDLDALAGEFTNELLNQVQRLQVGQDTRRIREVHLAKLFYADPGQASIDALLAELDDEDLSEDALEIEVPWATGGTDG